MNTQFSRSLGPALLALIVLGTMGSVSRARADFAPASWSAPAPADVKTELDPWLAQQSLADEKRQELDLLWPAPDEELTGAELLDRVATLLASAHPDAQAIVTFSRQPERVTTLPEFSLLDDAAQPNVVRLNLRLLYGAWLARHDMHEEALARLEGIEPNDVADPASLLFYRSVCHHRLRDKEACLPTLAQLLENEAEVPRRYRELAQLMQADLEPLKPDTLDEIARLMDSVRRRLDLARVGKRVRDEEDEVIAKLDKMIDELESQRQKAQSQSTASPQDGKRPTTPQDDSRGGSNRGQGDVDPKKLVDGGNWGNLPPKQRQEALQQISKELPAHYREAVEEYFRKLAREGDQ